jgi:carboxymethylenebutenolidase
MNASQTHLPDTGDPPGQMAGYWAFPDDQQEAPGVLVLHAWWGLNGFMRAFCDRLAAEGFTVFAPDLYEGQVVETIPEAEALAEALDDDWAYRTTQEAARLLLRHPRTRGGRLGVVGFSLGAAYALMLDKHIAAAVVYYGTNAASAIPPGPPLLGHFAEQDPYEPLEDVRALEATLQERGKRTEFSFYPGTVHWFCESDRPEYIEPAAEQAWQRTVVFLKRVLG